MTAGRNPFAVERLRAGTWSLVCRSCGYGVARPVPPDRCPMCHQSDGWGWRLLRRAAGASAAHRP